MTARILVVDDLIANTKLLEARLSAEYYEVLIAHQGMDAITICKDGRCDIVLLDVMMPGMDGFEVCRRLKSDPATAHIPVVMVTALDQPADRVRGLEAGADDFLTKPIQELALLARVRSLARLKVVVDELRARALTSSNLGMTNLDDPSAKSGGDNARILLVDDRASSSERILSALAPLYKVELEKDPQDALFQAAERNYDLIIVSLALLDYDALRLCSQIRALERTRQLPILIIADIEDTNKILRGLDLGVNDYLMRPIDKNELLARTRTQIRRKRYADSLRHCVQTSLEMAVLDPLTGLNNRRFMESHLTQLLAKAKVRTRPFALMILDIDHFKRVNDTYGHGAGDDVLKGFADRIKQVIRPVDLLCRLGGEEFVILMPDSNLDIASKIAERVRATVEDAPFVVENGAHHLPITVSIGLAARGNETRPEELLKRADAALYESKTHGRNRVTLAAA
ncbi:MAG: PleD family two-component system response regulator [Hyphomicrobiales bacterium]|nr:PleD family two-component system response regulator [Hyphomicrobiales bacterium]MDE2114879.1 PleD family two-component system response regulator [Hyphomicrobiales bacterium]